MVQLKITDSLKGISSSVDKRGITRSRLFSIAVTFIPGHFTPKI